MFDELSVAENIFMGHAPITRMGRLDWQAMREKSRTLLDALESDLDPTTPVKQLGVAQKHMVEIARALSHDARIVIMDEPTAALSAREIEDLFRIVERLKKDGRAILFISHKFDEIFRIADRWSCLRDGEQVGEGSIAETSERRARQSDGRTVDRQGLPREAEFRSARRCWKSKISPTRPNLTASHFPSGKAKFSGSMDWSARAVRKPCNACSV